MPTTKQAYEIARRTNRLAVQLDYALRTVEVGSGVPEAPADGKQYGRQDEEWSEIIHPASGIPDAPIDGKQYGRQSAAWTEIVSGGGVNIVDVVIDSIPYTTPIVITSQTTCIRHLTPAGYAQINTVQPFILPGTIGQVIIVFGHPLSFDEYDLRRDDDINYPGSNLSLGVASRPIKRLYNITLIYDGVYWVETSYVSGTTTSLEEEVAVVQPHF